MGFFFESAIPFLPVAAALAVVFAWVNYRLKGAE